MLTYTQQKYPMQMRHEHVNKTYSVCFVSRSNWCNQPAYYTSIVNTNSWMIYEEFTWLFFFSGQLNQGFNNISAFLSVISNFYFFSITTRPIATFIKISTHHYYEKGILTDKHFFQKKRKSRNSENRARVLINLLLKNQWTGNINIYTNNYIYAENIQLF